MASFGAKRPRFAKIKTEPENNFPTYEAPVTIGKMIKGDLSINYASGKLFADDELAESVDEFSSGSIALETDDITDPIASQIYGLKVENQEVAYKSGDTPPPGGLTYFKVLMRRGVKFFKGYYYPRVQAVLGNDTAQTKGDSITFGTSTTNFTVFQCNTSDWRRTREFTNEADCIAWCDSKLTGTVFTPQTPPTGDTGDTGDPDDD